MMSKGEVIEQVEVNGFQIQNHDKKWRADKDIVLAAVRNNGRALYYASDDLKDDQNVVLAAVSNDGRALDFATKKCRSDKLIVLAAVNNNPLALYYAGNDLKKDNKILGVQENSYRKVIINKVIQDGLQLRLLEDKWKADKAVVLKAVQNFGLELNCAADDLKNSKEIVLAAVTSYGWALQYAGEALRDNQQIVKAAVLNNGSALCFAGENCRRNKDIVLLAVKNNPQSLKFALNGLSQDKDCLIAAGLWDDKYSNPKKIMLSMSFTFDKKKTTKFAVLLQNHSFFFERFIIFASNTKICVENANTFDREWANIQQSCLGTFASYQRWKLKLIRPPEWSKIQHSFHGTFTSCHKWCGLKLMKPEQKKLRLSHAFKYHLGQSNLMVQVVEWHQKEQKHILGENQVIERKIARNLGIKVFRVHQQKWSDGSGRPLNSEHAFRVVEEVKKWYDENCSNMLESDIFFDDEEIVEY